MKVVQACLDVASHVIATEGYREPADYGDVFRILAENDVLSSDLAAEIVEMAGFRNVLAHEYAKIDDERVYDHLQDLDRFKEFATAIASFAGIAQPDD